MILPTQKPAILAACLALLLAGQSAQGERPVRPPTRALHATGWVIGKESAGAGALVDRRSKLMLTNFHVVKDEGQLFVVFPVYQSGKLVADRDFYWKNWKRLAVPATVLYRDAKRDLALIRLATVPRTVRPLSLAAALPDIGERLFRVGSPSAENECWRLDVGKVRELKTANLTYPSKQRVMAGAVMSELPGTNGHSGAAVVNARGQLVAIHAAKENATSLSVSIAVNEVRAFLTEALGQRKDKVRRAASAVSQNTR